MPGIIGLISTDSKGLYRLDILARLISINYHNRINGDPKIARIQNLLPVNNRELVKKKLNSPARDPRKSSNPLSRRAKSTTPLSLGEMYKEKYEGGPTNWYQKGVLWARKKLHPLFKLLEYEKQYETTTPLVCTPPPLWSSELKCCPSKQATIISLLAAKSVKIRIEYRPVCVQQAWRRWMHLLIIANHISLDIWDLAYSKPFIPLHSVVFHKYVELNSLPFNNFHQARHSIPLQYAWNLPIYVIAFVCGTSVCVMIMISRLLTGTGALSFSQVGHSPSLESRPIRSWQSSLLFIWRSNSKDTWL